MKEIIKRLCKSNNLSDNIKDTSDDILSEIIECEHRGKCDHLCVQAFKIISDELNFYRKMNLPLPRICFKCRSAERLLQRTKLEVIRKKCQCAGVYSDGEIYKNKTTHNHGNKHCEVKFSTNYTDKDDLLYCEHCYQQEVT